MCKSQRGKKQLCWTRYVQQQEVTERAQRRAGCCRDALAVCACVNDAHKNFSCTQTGHYRGRWGGKNVCGSYIFQSKLCSACQTVHEKGVCTSTLSRAEVDMPGNVHAGSEDRSAHTPSVWVEVHVELLTCRRSQRLKPIDYTDAWTCTGRTDDLHQISRL